MATAIPTHPSRDPAADIDAAWEAYEAEQAARRQSEIDAAWTQAPKAKPAA